MQVAAGTVIRFEGVFFFAVSADDNQRIKIKGWAFNAVYNVVPIGVVAVLQTVGMFAIGGERIYFRCRFYQKPRRCIENFTAEV